MKTNVTWDSNMNFNGLCDENQLFMDAKPPLGKAKGFTPKELVALGISGCTAMDVVALLKKYKQDVQQFDVESEVISTKGSYPEVFASVHLTFKAVGSIEKEKYIEAVTLSQTKYCGVSAMLLKAVPIDYDIILNHEKIGSGKANFQ